LESLHAESTEEVEEAKEVVTQQAGLTADQIEELVQLISEAVNRKFDRMDADDIVDYSSAEFSIGYDNRVELDSISFNADEVSDTVNSIVDSVLTEYFENLIPTEEETETETPYAVEQ
jgi:transcription termination factor NusB